MIPDVEHYLAHHRASEIDSCAVGLGEKRSAPAAHIDSVLPRIWKCAGCGDQGGVCSQFPMMDFGFQ